MSYDSTDLGDGPTGTYGVTVERWTPPWLREPILDIQQPAQGIGVSQGTNYGPRILAPRLLVQGQSQADLLTKLDSIMLKLNPANGDKQIKFDAYSDRYFLGRLQGSLQFDPLGIDAARFSPEFICADGAGYSTTQQNNSFSVITDPDTFNVESVASVVGTDYAYPIWYLRNSTGASITSAISLSNTTTSETMTWQGTLEDGRWLAIATGDSTTPAFGRYTLHKSTGIGTDPTTLSYTEQMVGYQSGSLWPRLKPGVQNAMSVSGITTGTVQWIYRARYL